MRSESRTRSQSRRRDKNGGLFRAFSNYICNVSPSSVISTVRSAGASVASSLLPSDEEDRRREQVQWAGFDKIEVAENVCRHVLLLAYGNGFQIWDVQDSGNVRELVSKRDGPVAFLRMQPWPYASHNDVNTFKEWLPLLLVVTGDDAGPEGNSPGSVGVGSANSNGGFPETASIGFIPTVVRFYSLRSHSYVHSLRFRSAIYGVRCSPRIIAVALQAQIYCFDAATLQNTFSVITYPMSQGGQGPGYYLGYGPMAVGPRWLAYAANHAPVQHTGRVSPQSVSLSSSPLNGNIVAQLAKESSKQIAAGIVTLGDMGYKKLSKYCTELLPDVSSPPKSVSPNWRNVSSASVGYGDPEHAGTVIVKDFVSKVVVAQFKAHKSPLSALCFDPSGTLLVTASTQGHNINVFRIMPSPLTNNSSPGGANVNTSYVHLYSLHRGMTNAIIQDISFSDDSSWIAVSSCRGTSHLFPLSPFGGAIVPHAHGGALMNSGTGSAQMQVPACAWLPSNTDMHSVSGPVTLYDAYKIKNGNDGWCGTITGAAAVATGRPNISGAVAVAFHNSKCQTLQSQSDDLNSKTQLWVFSPSGHVTRYALRPYAMGGMVVCRRTSAIGTDAGQIEDLSSLIQPLQKWDLGRKLNWIEREDDIEFVSPEVEKEGKNVNSGLKNNGTFANAVHNKHLETGMAFSKEKHRLYLSKAEVHVQKQRIPTWAKPEIYFHLMIPEMAGQHDCNNVGEFEIEKHPMRLIEVKRKDLMPVFENFQKQVHNVRNNASGSFQVADSACIECAKQQTNAAQQHVSSDVSGSSVQAVIQSGLKLQDKCEGMYAHPSLGEGKTIPVSSRKLIDHLSGHCCSSHMVNQSSNVSEIDTFGQQNEGSCAVQSSQDFLGVEGHSRIYSDQNSGSTESDSLKSSVGLNETATLSSDDNSDSFGSNPWDVSVEGETVSPSSVLHGSHISKQQLQQMAILEQNGQIHLHDNYIAVNDVKKEDMKKNSYKYTGHTNGEDALEEAPFPLCEED
eukprot:TRINITY_DN27283_c0_g2_i1.p1 TRINITY_DN27283_c0_g2~~TRINITY_DN27283_c0_g2_i1.p1  ORF type:complete len:1012 (+),score=227.66 TRINITY_DN27283_c0_g2_i1:785-3820(+)